MTRAGLTAFSLTSLAAVSLAVAQPPKAPSENARSEVKTELPEAAPTNGKTGEHRAMTLQVEVVATEAKAPAVSTLPSAPATPAATTPATAPVLSPSEPIVAAPPLPPAPPPVTLVAKVDLTSQRMTVLEHGQVKFTWAISSGAAGYDTPRGQFKPQWMAKDWFSRKYDNAPMPHSVFFKDGAAIHGTMNPASLGTAASHGCVRLSRANAAVFYGLVQRHSMAQTRIHVFGKPRHDPDLIASRQPSRQPSYAAAGRPRIATQPVPSSFGYQVYGSGSPQQLVYPGDPVRVVHYGSRAIRY